MSFVMEIFELADEMIETYTLSKLPKFIKNIIYKLQVRKIKKLIDKIPTDSISYDTIYDFASTLYNNNYNYETGFSEYGSIKVFEKDISSEYVNFTISLKFPMNEDMVYVHIDSYVKSVIEDKYIYSLKIRMSIIGEQGKNYLYFANLDRYQEISNYVLTELSKDQYSSIQIDTLKNIKDVLITNIKSYLSEAIGLFEINM